MTKYTAVKGMNDCLPPETRKWQALEQLARDTFASYGYSEIRTPIVEKTALFTRSVGETTSIVEKEMYSFVDQGDEALTLRPEGTAPVVRSYIESGMANQHPNAKLYYMGPMFRRERPQKGRYRQFHQIGVEIFGTAAPAADAEMIAMVWDLLDHQLHLPDLALEINSIGCAGCRPEFLRTLETYLASRAEKLCTDCQRRMKKNPMRVLDCKNEKCRELLQDAPSIHEFWCEGCQSHFTEVQAMLKLLHVPYIVNHRIVRGLDYYMRTAFEVITTRLGAQSAVVAGGRYDGLVRQLGGPDVPGVGFAIGEERLMLLLEDAGTLSVKEEQHVCFALLGEAARKALLPVIRELRHHGVSVQWDYEDRSLKAQMKHADKLGAKWVVIVGDEELANKVVQVKTLATGDQETMSIDKLVTYFSEKCS
ncbi:MAG: histidine--tRNA ligase [Deltaproteobacteria bacterium CG11_big_fil_rev_8_21_14_0_20_47_16]|nr:MAG: histidine--tRNA ligase [Deltaproteobacteria bacterium CG11_big_fil_rev_8_21_14_0_20_47_16]